MSEAENPLVTIGVYPRLAAARERGLVVAAKELPHCIEREGDAWVLRVEERDREAVLGELAAFEAEEEKRPPNAVLERAAESMPVLSLYVVAWLLSGFFLAQQMAPAAWEERGVAVNERLLNGEWWRAFTALTLHADVPHIVANLATGLLFAGFAIARLGTGLAWLGIVLSGALGNAINAWGYRGETHDSLGASTACFGALGLLVGAEVTALWREPQTRSHWRLVLPLGAGLALLAYLGTGGEEGGRVDYMAHCWGFGVGIAQGALAVALRAKERTPEWGQKLAAAAALALVGGAWVLAWW